MLNCSPLYQDKVAPNFRGALLTFPARFFNPVAASQFRPTFRRRFYASAASIGLAPPPPCRVGCQQARPQNKSHPRRGRKGGPTPPSASGPPRPLTRDCAKLVFNKIRPGLRPRPIFVKSTGFAQSLFRRVGAAAVPHGFARRSGGPRPRPPLGAAPLESAASTPPRPPAATPPRRSRRQDARRSAPTPRPAPQSAACQARAFALPAPAF